MEAFSAVQDSYILNNKNVAAKPLDILKWATFQFQQENHVISSQMLHSILSVLAVFIWWTETIICNQSSWRTASLEVIAVLNVIIFLSAASSFLSGSGWKQNIKTIVQQRCSDIKNLQ